MSYLVNREVSNFKRDIINSKVVLDVEKESFARELRGGLGLDIKNELKSPTKPSLRTYFRIKFSRWLTEFLERWKNLKIEKE